MARLAPNGSSDVVLHDVEAATKMRDAESKRQFYLIVTVILFDATGGWNG